MEIIQSLAPDHVDTGDSEGMEISLDELDTFTLRRLQKFVEVSRLYRGVGLYGY